MIKQFSRRLSSISAEVKSLAILSTIVLIESMQVILVAILIANSLPQHSPLTQVVFPERSEEHTSELQSQ